MNTGLVAWEYGYSGGLTPGRSRSRPGGEGNTRALIIWACAMQTRQSPGEVADICRYPEVRLFLITPLAPWYT